MTRAVMMAPDAMMALMGSKQSLTLNTTLPPNAHRHSLRRRAGSKLNPTVFTSSLSVLASPAWRSAHPILDNLGAKLVHFLVDYHHDWFSSLDLDKSDGKHKQMDGYEVQDVLDRLETIPEAQGEVQIFNRLKIAHSEFHGAQNVYSAPFNSYTSKPRMVCIDLYCFVFVCIVCVLTCIRLYCLVSCNLMVAGLRLFHPTPPILWRKEI